MKATILQKICREIDRSQARKEVTSAARFQHPRSGRLIGGEDLELVNPNGRPRPVTMNSNPHLLSRGQSLRVNDTLPRRRADPP
jgi:hypothetical protein